MVNYLHETKTPFDNCYNRWRETRVNKLISFFGNDWTGKRVLELACAYGNIGLHLKSLGADVTFADARQKHLDIVLHKDNTAKTILLDQDNNWNLNESFDIIIHFGVLYHLDNWRRDLQCAINHSNIIVLESAVADCDYEFEYKLTEEDEDGENAFNTIGTVPSAKSIESWLSELDCSYTRFDDSDLNTKWFNYDWVVTNPDLSNIVVKTFEDKPLYGGRRFWLINKSPSIS
jgi:SAM-dependent methyltransferase